MKRYLVQQSPKARRDVLNIWKYIARENPDAATAVVRRIERQIERLQEYPRVGPERPIFGEGVRGLTAGLYVIIYLINDDRRVVEILRVMHMARDLMSEFL